MDGMGVVCRDEEALGEHAQISLFADPQRERDAAERVGEQAGCRALLRLAADLFVVKCAEDRHAARSFGGQESLQ